MKEINDEVELQERLDRLRAIIDQADKKMLNLLISRFEAALEIAEIKERLGQNLYDPDREAHILRQLSMQIGENESLFEILSVYEGMLKLSKKAQNKHLESLKSTQK